MSVESTKELYPHEVKNNPGSIGRQYTVYNFFDVNSNLQIYA